MAREGGYLYSTVGDGLRRIVRFSLERETSTGMDRWLEAIDGNMFAHRFAGEEWTWQRGSKDGKEPYEEDTTDMLYIIRNGHPYRSQRMSISMK